MFGLDALSGPFHAGAIVGLVLAEALLLDVGYSTLGRWTGAGLSDTPDDR